jgi:hypothetical protein
VIRRLQTQGRLNDGTTLAYAWGLEIGTYRGLPIVEHGGSLGGYRANILRFPLQHTSVALLCNLGTIAPAGLARRVADVVLGERFTQSVPPAPPGGIMGSILGAAPPPGPPDDVREYAGTYYSEEVESSFTFTAVDGGLMFKRETDPSPIGIARVGRLDEFRGRGLVIHFQRDANRKVVALTVDAGRVRDIKFTKR